MTTEQANKIRLFLALATATILALSGITLCYQIVTLHDSYTGLPTWLNTLLVLVLFSLSVTMSRSSEDDNPSKPA